METRDRLLAVLGALLVLTLLLPVEDALMRPVQVWHLFGVVAFSALLQAVYPALLGGVLLLLALSDEGPGTKGIVATLGFALPMTILGHSPMQRLAYLGAWENALGHQLLLVLGIIGAATGCRLAVAGASRTAAALSASMGVALLVAYHLTPLPTGAVPLIERFRELHAGTIEGGFPLLSATYSLVLTVVLLGVSGLVLLAIRADRYGSVNREASALVGWIASGMLPAFALPLCIKAGMGAGELLGVLLLVRHLLLLLAVLVGTPFAIAALSDALAARRMRAELADLEE
jgi:hypothetical protein